jgi:hypothetical protein
MNAQLSYWFQHNNLKARKSNSDIFALLGRYLLDRQIGTTGVHAPDLLPEEVPVGTQNNVLGHLLGSPFSPDRRIAISRDLLLRNMRMPELSSDNRLACSAPGATESSGSCRSFGELDVGLPFTATPTAKLLLTHIPSHPTLSETVLTQTRSLRMHRPDKPPTSSLTGITMVALHILLRQLGHLLSHMGQTDTTHSLLTDIKVQGELSPRPTLLSQTLCFLMIERALIDTIFLGGDGD